MHETCENWLGFVNGCDYAARQTRGIYQVQPYSVDFKLPGALKFIVYKTVLSKSKVNAVLQGPENIWIDRKTQRQLLRRVL